MQVILDTNFLMLAYQFKIDIFGELDRVLPKNEFIISSKILNELEKISESSKRDKLAARFALKLIKDKKVKIQKSNEKVDDWILDYAKNNKAIVCTNDLDLKERLKTNGIRVIGLRGKTRIDFL